MTREEASTGQLGTLRLPLLTSLISPLDAGVVDSPAGRHHVVAVVLALLRSLLRIETALSVSSIEGRSPRGRLVPLAVETGARRGGGWVGSSLQGGGRHRKDSDDDSDDG